MDLLITTSQIECCCESHDVRSLTLTSESRIWWCHAARFRLSCLCRLRVCWYLLFIIINFLFVPHSSQHSSM